MITYLKSNLFFSPAKVLVNTVNTDGVMGKGIAKEFKKHFPGMFKVYRKFCENKELDVGKLMLYQTPNKWVMNFPTKTTWRKKSEIEYIKLGLEKFVNTYESKNIDSIAFPPLGCGNGELSWELDVKPVMEQYLRPLPISVYIHLYTPDSSEAVPEHNHINDVSEWLRTEPNTLSFQEVLVDLKKHSMLDEELVRLKLEYTTEGFSFHTNNKVCYLYEKDLMNAWAILRKNGVLSITDLPDSLVENYNTFKVLYSSLDYVSEVDSSKNYDDLDQGKEKSLQLVLSSGNINKIDI